MKVAAPGRQQAKFLRGGGIGQVLGGGVAAGHHLHALAAMALELGEQGEFFVGAEFVPRRVRNNRHAAGLGDPGHGIFQAGPAVRHVAGFAFNQVLAKHLLGVLADATVHQKAGKVGARDQLMVARKLQGAFKGPGDADLG